VSTDVLAGRHVLVFAGASGLGLAVSRRLVADGAHCHVSSRHATTRAGSGESRQPGWSSSQADVRNRADLTRTFREAVDALGDLDAVVYCPGVTATAPHEDLADTAIDEIVAVNLIGFLAATTLAIPILRGRPDAAIVALSSFVAERGQPFIASYAASKAGLNGAIRTLAVELGPDIRVNGVAPGSVRTNMWNGDLARRSVLLGCTADAVERAALARIPLGRFQDPSAVAAAAAFLLSADARDITGQILAVDGGAGA
jgi:NAD(P)-dependent dehydrogenase (short-subunit alcohol dehydrogenase family)